MRWVFICVIFAIFVALMYFVLMGGADSAYEFNIAGKQRETSPVARGPELQLHVESLQASPEADHMHNNPVSAEPSSAEVLPPDNAESAAKEKAKTEPSESGMSVVLRSEIEPLPYANLKPRKTIDKMDVPLLVVEGEKHRVYVKFHDRIMARVDAAKNTLSIREGDVLAIDSIAREFDVTFVQGLKMSREKLLNLEERAAINTGVVPADLEGIILAETADASASQSLCLAKKFRKLDSVEYVYIETVSMPPPPPGDISPVTPDLTSLQSYCLAATGVDIDYAWNLGAKGAGIRVTDCEYGGNLDHEDLVDAGISMEPGQTVHPDVNNLGYGPQHATAVLGVLCAQDNGYGMTGLVPDAEMHFFSEWTVARGWDRSTCIANAIASSAYGDIVVLEMQTTQLDPVDTDVNVWTLIKTGTDAGVIVIAAAGNGTNDLDGAAYSTYRGWGDSGAIIVGAADSARKIMYFSSFGARVDLQGLGSFTVATLGYGDYAEYGGDINQRYTTTFAGTSSATPIVAGVCVALQSYCEATFGIRMSPAEMRQLLIATGRAQTGAGGHIGPLPQAKSAIDELQDRYTFSVAGTSSIPDDQSDVLNWVGNTNMYYDVLFSTGSQALVFEPLSGASNLTAVPGTTSFTNELHQNSQCIYYKIKVRSAL